MVANFFNAKSDTLYRYGVYRLLESEVNFRKTRGAETIFFQCKKTIKIAKFEHCSFCGRDAKFGGR